MGKPKRDRWESSSEDEEDNKQKALIKDKKYANKGNSGTTDVHQPHHPHAVLSREATVVRTTTLSQQQQQQPQQPSAVVTTRPESALPLHNPLLQGCRSVYDTYDRISRVSEGTYGIVWKARDLATNEIVALKQIKFHVDEDQPHSNTMGFLENDNNTRHSTNGFPQTALREISILLALSHESIVSVREMVVGDAMDKVFMVMEFFDFDLSEGLASHLLDGGPLTQAELKSILQQIVAGAQHMHSHWYLHRDLKPSNILVQPSTGRIALADFGLARRYQEPRKALTMLVVTLWYRCPELLFGEVRYGPPVDMWSIGCIFGELILGGKEAVLPGQGELDQIDRIFSLVGTPDATTWPDFEKLPNAGLFRWKQLPPEELLLPRKFPIAQPLAGHKAFLDRDGYNLLSGLLTLDPAKRLTADEALNHPYFRTGVKPQRPQFV